MSAIQYARDLEGRLASRPNRRISLKLRTVLKGFGYQRRTAGSLIVVREHLDACQISTDMTIENPKSLDERIELILTKPLPQAPTASSRALDDAPDLATVAQKVISATVMVSTDTGCGSGFIISADGLVVTARHVVDDESGISLREVDVKLSDDRPEKAVVFRSHRQLDFALLWLMGRGPFASVPIGDPRTLRPAETMLAVGCPSAFRNTVSRGIVCNPAQAFNRLECIQTDTAIDHGNSGGPLVDAAGRVMGINLWGVGELDSRKFALPVDYLAADIALAVGAGRDTCVSAAYCLACGNAQFQEATWYCKSCGTPYTPEPAKR